VECEAVTDIRCDICSESTRPANGTLHYGRLEAQWGHGTAYDDERYKVHLCGRCFFATLVNLNQERRTISLFEDDARLGEVE
jgi:hypothetical protein